MSRLKTLGMKKLFTNVIFRKNKNGEGVNK